MENQDLIDSILDKALDQQDISEAEALILLQQTKSDNIPTQVKQSTINKIQQTGDRLRKKQVGDAVTYVINRNINFTNICEQHCSFCAFRRDAEAEGSFWLDTNQIIAKTAEAVAQGATEICMQGGLHPEAKIQGTSLAYYLELATTIKNQFPQIHLHAFSPQEVQFIAREDDISYQKVITALQKAGVDSMPGTAAEILDDSVRKIICPEKINTATWLEIIGTAHRLGLPTTSTMLSGHIESPEQQIAHLGKLRSLQQNAIANNYPAKISEFIILPFVGQEAPKALKNRVGRDQPIIEDALVLTAVARIFLGNWIINHQPSWVKLGLTAATQALNWGCNDLGGTLMEEHITTMAGAQGGTCMTVEELQTATASLGRPSKQRQTIY
ncbi:7,8-didemethyl-8-hydroxy-5-deazariboflavin synthase subunit CofH [Xenococcus sp. PCC 7305]|uniref:7,8-didemethyl-8-hydroxy-5-deazariboflavin synthase subunit CofH n=1 Tax=Xenococcus sp. PCC 7305 TaxID=102125 RepID=UPI000308F606|nr:7,8-didemethyl-8-hydroxy-5-deazariboflavin synthase subunit CofH [Xenococcus sp. PCC 7305]